MATNRFEKENLKNLLMFGRIIIHTNASMLVTQHEVSSDWYKNSFGGGGRGENKVFGIAPFYYNNWRSPKGDSLKKET